MSFFSLSLNAIRTSPYKTYLRYKKRYSWKDKANYIYLKEGQPLILTGGVATGKTKKLLTLKEQIERQNARALYIDAMLPLSDWLPKEVEEGRKKKNLSEKIDAWLKEMDFSNTYLLLDNAEHVRDSRKLAVILALLEKCRNTVVACKSINTLNWKLRRRLELKNAIVEHMGDGGQLFDATLLLLAVLVFAILFIARDFTWLFTLAALRYLLMGSIKGEVIATK